MKTKSIAKSTLAPFLVGCSLTTGAQAATISYTVDTTITSAESVAANSNPGFLVRDGATLTLETGGSLTQADQSSLQTALQLGTSALAVTDPGLSGNFVMNAGSITANEAGGNSIVGIVAYGSSVASINEGIININEVGNPGISLNSVGFRAFESSRFIINGGDFNISETAAGDITPFTASDDSVVTIYGGLWTFTGGPPIGFNVSDNAVVNLYGDFNVPSGSITDLTGTITGTLLNGDAFSMLFDRSAGGTINIIPEPTVLSLVAFLGAGGLFVRRRNRM